MFFAIRIIIVNTPSRTGNFSKAEPPFKVASIIPFLMSHQIQGRSLAHRLNLISPYGALTTKLNPTRGHRPSHLAGGLRVQLPRIYFLGGTNFSPGLYV